MRLLALNLSRMLDRPVADKTGLTARYDFTIQFPLPDRDRDGAGPPGPPDSSVVSTALRENIGLRLEPYKAPAEYIVIDHIEKLTAN
jgi:uncharacterized protein (TIGR03435 family)